jgi:hypothetical protein
LNSQGRGEASLGLPKQEVFEQQSLPALLELFPQELSREDLKDVLLLLRRFFDLLGGDRAERFHQMHREELRARELQQRAIDLHRQQKLIQRRERRAQSAP